jgi:acyl transferase domain-containing protein
MSQEPTGKLSPLKQAYLALEALQARYEALERGRREPIAVVGIGCRFPGGADEPASFWRLLAAGGDAVAEPPPGRWDMDALYDPDPDAPGKMYARAGGFVADIAGFDAAFFGISAREADSMDPQQRLLLEVAWAALEDAAIAPSALAGSKTGVFVGIGANDYQMLGAATEGRLDDPYTATGNALSVAAGRVAYVLDLRGPCVALDTACSSSLVAVHLACQSLRAGESDLALAGGVSLMLAPEITVSLCKLRALSPTSRCHTFDAAADGYVRGEGCGVVALRRLGDALRDGDPIWATIRGSAMNHDGRSNGLTAPSRAAQEAVLRAALAAARTPAQAVGYVEAHGTGTPLGDPIELAALGAVFGPGRDPARPLRVGSVKTNIGHLEPAAGIAGLIKAALAVHHGALPPHLHFQRLNPHAELRGLAVQTTLEPWPAGEPVAGVSSFGLSGTNAHVVLAAPPPGGRREDAGRTAAGPVAGGASGPARSAGAPGPGASDMSDATGAHGPGESDMSDANGAHGHGEPDMSDATGAHGHGEPDMSAANGAHGHGKSDMSDATGAHGHVASDRPAVPVVLSAATPGALRALAGRWAADLAGRRDDELGDVARTAATGRTHLEHRLATVGRDAGGLAAALEAFAREGEAEGVYAGAAALERRPRVAFLYTGQGSQHAGMGAALLASEPVYRAAIGRAEAALRGRLDRPLTALLRDPGAPLAETAYTQPAIVAVALALTELWRSRGVEPDVVIGHSVGEYAAAWAAGVFEFEDVLALVAERGRRMQALPRGAMAAVAADEARVRAAIAGHADAVAVAAINGPGDAVIAGPEAELAAVVAALSGAGIRCRPLRVSHAFHAPAMDPVLPWLERAVAGVPRQAPRVPLISNLTGAVAGPELLRDPAYWARHARAPVQFLAGCRALAELGPAALVEVGPRPALLGAAQRCLPEFAGPLLASLREGRDADLQWTECLARLHALGVAVDLVGARPGRRLRLPTYPFARRRHWYAGADGPAVAPVASDMPERTGPEGQAPSRMSEGTGSWSELAGLAPALRLARLVERVGREAMRVLRADAPPAARRGLFELGMDSLMAVELRRRLEAGVGVALSPTVAFDHPSVEALARHLAELLAGGAEVAGPGAATATREPVAIVGLACRFPGGANDPEAYWRLLVEGGDGVIEVPRERWDVEAIFDPDPDAPGRTYTRRSGFLQGVDVARFDAAFFGISPREAASMDPQQRLLLEVVWEALERAGQPADRLEGAPAGVYVGVTLSDYAALAQAGGLESADMYAGTGNTFNVLAGRVSFVLGLRGPNLPVDTACSSSLVAVHLACRGLRAGECDLAIAGGVNLMLTPGADVMYSRMRATAPDGRCKAFDAAADGLVRGEGCGVVVLKRLSDALRDDDPIVAVIRGSAVGHDGRSSGLTVPNGAAQQVVIRRALADAGAAPAAVDYVEAHGTGTPLGDPIELHALAAALGPGRGPEAPLRVSSVKTNIGHLEAAAGVAGLIKAALALERAQVPKLLHFQRLNPQVEVGAVPLEIADETRPWPAGTRPRLCGISSFGISGTNAHVLLGEAPPRPTPPPSGPTGPIALPLSARAPEALRAQAGRWQAYLEARPELDLGDLLHTAGARRSHLERRLAVVGDSPAALAAGLAAFVEGTPSPAVFTGVADVGRAGRVVFVFPGQGGQWRGMGRRLLAEAPAFREAIAACDAAARPWFEPSIAEILAGEDDAWMHAIDLLQPVLCALQIGLAALWRSWGVEPAAVVGHSLGEVAACHVAGSLGLEDTMRVITTRSRLFRARMSAEVSGMLLAELPRAAAEAASAGEPGLAIAASNGPRTTVIGGEIGPLRALQARLQARDVFCRIVVGAPASHTPLVEPMLDELRAALAEVRPRAATVPMYSTATGEVLAGPEVDAAYWCANLRGEVRFAAAVERLVADGATIFLELSPHPTLQLAVEPAAQAAGGAALVSLQRDQDERACLQAALAGLYVAGHPVDWRRIRPRGRTLVDLPTYPWQRRRHWVEAPAPATAGDPLLGVHARLARPPREHVWDATLDPRRLPPVGELAIDGVTVTAPSLWLALAAAAARARLGAAALREVEVVGGAPVDGAVAAQVVGLSEGTGHEWAVYVEAEAVARGSAVAASREGAVYGEAVARGSAGAASGEGAVYGEAVARGSAGAATSARDERRGSGDRAAGAGARGETGADAADGRRGSGDRAAGVGTRGETGADGAERGAADGWAPGAALAAARSRCAGRGRDPVARLEKRGVQLGASLRGLGEVGVGDGEAVAALRLADAELRAPWPVHPAHLEAGAAILAALADPDDRAPLRVIAGAARLAVHGPPRAVRWCRATLAAGATAYAPAGDVELLDEAGARVAEVRGLTLARPPWPLARAGIAARLADWLLELAWRPRARGPARGEPPSGWILLADAGGVAAALQAALAADGAAVVVAPPGTLDPADHLSVGTWLKDQLPRVGPAPAVVFAWSLDAPHGEAALAQIEAAQVQACAGLLHVIQGLHAAGCARAAVWVATRGAQRAREGDAVAPAAAPVWGLARSAALEHPELWGGLVDLDEVEPAAAAALLRAEVVAADADDQVAFRAGERRVARVVRAAPPTVPARALALRADATYLLTGGLGGVGLELAAWLVERGARHLVITGRTGLPPREAWDGLAEDDPARPRVAAVRALAGLGAEVVVLAADVAEPADVAGVLATIRRDLPPLRGVLHAAGVTTRTDLLHTDAASLAAVLRPKVAGAWLLHAATRGLPLEFFVMFSSAASVWGSAFAGAYGAANHFLDALAHARRAAGLPALAVSWGGWASGGMVTAEAEHYFTAIGLGLMPPEHATEALEVLMQSGAAHRAVSPARWSVFKAVYEARRARPLLAEIDDREAPTSAGGGGDVRAALATASPAERRERLVAHVRAAVAAVLRCGGPEEVALDEGFFQLGMDSLMSAQLRARLQDGLATTLPATAVFEHPTVERLARWIEGALFPAAAEPEAAAASEDELMAELARELDDLAALTRESDDGGRT